MRTAALSTLFALSCATLFPAAQQSSPPGAIAFTNGKVIAGFGPRGLQVVDASIIVNGGKVVLVGRPLSGRPPEGARIVDLAGKFVMPGIVVAHAHVSDVNGLKPRAYTDENTRRQLGVFARYGITTVFSLGGEQAPAFALRDAQAATSLDRARIFVSGAVITGRTPEEARAAVAKVAAQKPDIIKIRVDDNLGSTAKMTPEVYRAVIDESHKLGLKVAAHIFYLDDAKDLLRAGVDMIAHSVRDKPIDDEFIQLMKARNVPYCPTLTREISVFAYEGSPRFFDDPFFLREADRGVVAQLREPARQEAMRTSKTAQRYKAGLAVAMANVKRAADAGVLIAMGTDSGAAPERFEGFFEHLEMEMMVDAGMTPAQVLRASTSDAARAMNRDDVGAIAAGRWADFVVLDTNPLTDILNARAISSVWIAGNLIQR
jgi:imidazolonepropionase-like amidohydrolase